MRACPKDLPRVVDKLARKRELARHQRSIWQQIDARDKHACRCCNAKGQIEKHHVVFRSHGGATSTQNCLSLCLLCHRLAQTYRITIHGESCDGPLTFAMSPAVVTHIFTARKLMIPTQVRIEQLERDR